MRSLPTGIYTPLPCFFDANEDIDYDAFKRHVKFIAQAGTVPVVSGTMGEAVHLANDERSRLVEEARRTLDECGLVEMPVIAGVGAPSTRETVKLSLKAAKAGADFVMVIPPGYYAGSLIANPKSLADFFIDVANVSPVPVIMYNFPTFSGGIDMSSDQIINIVKSAPNICGIKLTCANVGKLTRITATANDASFKTRYPRSREDISFTVIDGFIDFLLPSALVGSGGAISGLANITPLACVELWKLCRSIDTKADQIKAQELQNMISLADGIALKIGMPGMKALLHHLFGYGKSPRRPIAAMGEGELETILANEHLNRLLAFEASLKK